MSEETKQLLLKRLKSFLWRAGVLFALAGVNFTMENLGLLNLPTWVVGLIGLLAGEGTKWLKNHTNVLGARLKK